MKSLRKVQSGDSATSHFIDDQEILNIPVNSLNLDPTKNLRTSYDEEGLRELASSIELNGLLEPIGIDKRLTKSGKYQLVYGFRRALAISKFTDIKFVKAITVSQDANTEVIQLLENIQREDLSDYEIAKSLHSIKISSNINNIELSLKINKSIDWIKKKMVHANIIHELENESNKEELLLLKNLTTQQVSPISKLDIQDKKEALKLIKSGSGTVSDIRSFSKNKTKTKELAGKNGKKILLLESRIKDLTKEKSKIDTEILRLKTELKQLNKQEKR
ncbi:MAG: ParB/RepB/Spo0J family partition protein [Leptospira sp.]|nr:ParB/RepB/Spo0J family partition protein [Leptospira sp.]